MASSIGLNYGQSPHNPRIGIAGLINVLLGNSFEEKIYLAVFFCWSSFKMM